MTNIELQFMESGVRFFREQCNQKVDWDELKLFLGASIILGGLCSNDTNSCPSAGRAVDAVKLALALVEAFKESKK